MFQKILVISWLAFFLATSPALAATPDPASAAEWKKAETLLVTGKAGQAYPIFATLLQRFPGHSSLTLG
ncbi:MAG: hypothetical protein LBT38_05155, partial [Deltaproteobacteria bacterium]|nr:hypothetical protein [Deltaproteobacteria bacterium]